MKVLCLFALLIVNHCFSQIEIVNFLQIDADINVDFDNKSIAGQATYQFQILKETDSIFLDAKNMESVFLLQGELVTLKTTTDKIWIHYPFQPSKTYSISFSYQAKPKQTLYFFEDQVWTQGQGKYTSHWLPSIDNVNDKIIFNLSITAPQGFMALANGKLTNQKQTGNATQWNYTMQQPMSSYLAALVVGKFDKKTENSASGIPLEYYYLPEDESKVEPTYRYSKVIFDFLEREIGVDYPWQNYKQVPVRDFLYAGMENTTLTIFSTAFVTDSVGFIDKNYINVNAHELAHQWFGNLVTAKEDEHQWLQEGFATYYALLAEKEIFGEDYYYFKLYETAEQLMELSENGKGEALLSKGASSLTYYQKGAWALHILREKVGDLAFKSAVTTYLKKHQYQNVTTEDFLAEVEKTSQQDLTWFRENWLNQTAFKSSEALASLTKSEFIRNYLGLSSLRLEPIAIKKELYNQFLKKPVNDYYGQEVVYQLAEMNRAESEEFYKKAFLSESILTRQAIAHSLSKIPAALKVDYESLLNDDSYLTQEAALYNLWTNFPQEAAVYLEKTKDIIGFQDKNIRTLWLALALLTENYRDTEKQHFYNELNSYTSINYSFEIRKNAFQYLFGLQLFTDKNLADLVQACLHPNWRFASFSRELLDELLKDAVYKNRFQSLEKQLDKAGWEWLVRKLGN